MENPNKSLNSSYNYPFQNLADSCCMSSKKKEKWKIQSQLQKPFSLYTRIFLLLQLLLISAFQPVSSQVWDGVIVTQADFQALQAFKHELFDPKGILRSWNDSGFGACSGGWAGIKCAQGQVIVIQLPWKGLGGRITEKIGQLQQLRKLSLHDNVIGGSIPQELGFLPNLRGVQLFNNRLSGSIPPSLGSCPLLQTLDLSNNLLTGSIPFSLANSTKLFRLNLSHNSLSGLIPVSLTRSSSLIFLDLQYNNLSGAIPNSWGATQKKSNFLPLQHLSLSHNFFSGRIPASLGNLRELQEISVSHNQINGAIPVEIGGLSRLRALDLSNNAINGSLSDSLSNISSLVLLNLENNYLDNQIPEAIGRLQNLSVLNLKRNQFGGHIPATIGNISTLTQLDLSQNNLSGEIPDSLSDLNNLNAFNVSYNNLSGPSPSVPVSPPEKPKKHHRKLSTKDEKGLHQKANNGQATARAAAARGEKGVPPATGEVESGGEAGGKLVHFDGPMVFTADDLLCATAEIMGKSTYGTVYKATLEDGNQVAVKRLREKITKGQREFESEVNVLGKIRHPNLLALRAYYLGPKGEKLLVFDYIPKGSLATFLHARGSDTPIDWPTRMKIAQGMTRGLFYLHNNENIIHGNLTSSNVLLDERTNAKIADYGLSRLMTAAANTNVIATASVLGYRAPELSKLKKANTKTDVYSLGVIILELLTGKSPGEAMNGVDLPQWVASVVKEEWTNEVFDLELMKDASIIGDELLNTLKLALHCVDPSPAARPEVQQVLQQLEEIKPEAAASPGPSGDDVAGVPSTSE
ncbi:hypothetical protein OIU78_005359 [Salix suchowensis]|nr:hypothetical protein OIU78_005359 [Salix suchowensis]